MYPLVAPAAQVFKSENLLSVTRWLDYFLMFGHLQEWKFPQ